MSRNNSHTTIDRTRLVVRDNPRLGFVVTGQFISGMYHNWGRRWPTCRECGERFELGDVARWDLGGGRMSKDGSEVVHSRCKPYEGPIPRTTVVVSA